MVLRTETETAFSQMYQQYAGRVLAYCVRRMPRDDARDAAAEVFTVAWRRFGDIPTGDRTLPWLYGVAANVVKNHRRTRRRAGRLTEKLQGLGGDRPAGPETRTLDQDEYEAVRAAIGRLRPRYREVLRLVEWEGLTRNEAAEVLHLSRAAVDQRMHRAYHHLEHELEKEKGSPS